MKTNNKEFNKRLILLIVSAAYFGLVLLLTSFICSAASDQDYFPMYQNQGGGFTPENIAIIENYFDLENNYIVMYKSAQFSDGVGYTYALSSKEHGCFFGEKNNDLIHFSLYYVGDGQGVIVGRFDITYSGQYYDLVEGGNVYPSFYNLVSSNYDTTLSYASNYNVLTNNTENAKIVLLYLEEVEPLPDDDTYPLESEKPDLDNYYDPSEAPLFDNSTVPSAIESIYNILKWFFGSGGIGGIINYLVDNTNWGLQKVINNIRQVLQNVSSEIQEVVSDFSDTVSGFLSDIQDKISDFYDDFVEFADLFINPFDQEEFDDQISSCQLISEYEQLLDNCDIIREVFATAQEKDSFVLYIDFENPFADSEHKIIASEISFNWLVPLRSVYRPFLWVFTLLECFIGGFQILGNIIGGKAK